MLLKDRQKTVSCSSLLCHLTIFVCAQPPPTHTHPTPPFTNTLFYLTPPPAVLPHSPCKGAHEYFTYLHPRSSSLRLHSAGLILRLSKFASLSLFPSLWLRRSRPSQCHATAARKSADSYHSNPV